MDDRIEDQIHLMIESVVERLGRLSEDPYIREALMKLAIRDLAQQLASWPGLSTQIADHLEQVAGAIRGSTGEAPLSVSDEDDPQDRTFWAGRQWKVTQAGILTLDEDFLIATHHLGALRPGQTPPMSDWPPHMARHHWLDLEDFEHAFCFALRQHEGAYASLPEGAVERAFEEARRIKAQGG